MKKLIIFTFILLVSTCMVEPSPICDYESEHKLVGAINDVVVDGISLNTLPGFTFPYILKGSDFSGPDVFNYTPIETDLQSFFPFSYVEVAVYPDGNLQFNITNLSGQVIERYNADFNSTTTDVDFYQTCY